MQHVTLRLPFYKLVSFTLILAILLSPQVSLPGRAGAVPLSVTAAPGYCAPGSGDTSWERITSVSYNRTAADKVVLTVKIWVLNPGNCTAGKGCEYYDNYPEKLNLWVDWDGDKKWETTEKAINKDVSGWYLKEKNALVYSKEVTIPSGSVKGATWLRANVSSPDDIENPCQAHFLYGNVYDKQLAPLAPFESGITATGPQNVNNEPTTGWPVELTANLTLPTGYKITSCSWSGDLTAGKGDIANKCKYKYTPKTGPGPAVATYGEKKVTLAIGWQHTSSGLKGTTTKTHRYKVFFEKAGSDRPEDDLAYVFGGLYQNPNWFTYWKDDKTVPGFDDTIFYDMSLGSNTFGQYRPGEDQVYVGPIASSENHDYTIAQTANCTGFTFIGSKGIDKLAETVKHEKTHQVVEHAWDSGGIWEGKTDSDNDDIPNDVETAYGTSNSKIDSCNMASIDSGYAKYGDEEYYARRVGEGKAGDPKKDWANPGKQTKTPYGPQPALSDLAGPVRAGGVAFPPFSTTAITNDDASLATIGLNFLDTDSDGLYNLLEIVVGVDVSTSNVFNVVIWLEDDRGVPIGWAKTELTLPTGNQSVGVQFPGELIWNNPGAYSYVIRHIELRAGLEGEIADAADFYASFMAYYSDFDPPDLRIRRNTFITYPNDIDGDGLYEGLATHFDLDVYANGTYTFTGILAGASPIAFASETVTYSGVGAGPQGWASFYLQWPVDEIYRAKQDGPYHIENLRVTDASGKLVDALDPTYETTSYSYAQFDHGATTLDPSGYQTDTVDRDGDGLVDYVDVTVKINTDTAQVANLSGTLSDNQGNPVDTQAIEVELVPGLNLALLSFSGAALGINGVDGPFELTGVTLLDADGNLLDAQTGGYFTPAIPVTQLPTAAFALSNTYTEEVYDTDADGFLNDLIIKVGIQSPRADTLVARGTLYDKLGRPIAESEWISHVSGLPGDYAMLIFPQPAIAANGVDGPFYLRDLTVQSLIDPSISVYAEYAYTTTPYQVADFGSRKLALPLVLRYASPLQSNLSDPAGDWLPGADPLDYADILSASAEYRPADGILVFTMHLGDEVPLTLAASQRNRWVWLLDTDQNASTGDPYNDIGVEYQVNLHVQWDGYYVDIRDWNNQWTYVAQAGVISGNKLTVTIPKSHLGGKTSFTWLALVEPFERSPGFDRFDIAPNSGHGKLP